MTHSGKDCLALDFDGVLCDSARETAATAWRAGQKIWSHWQGVEPPQAWVEGFCRVRPYLETGYQAIPMLRMVELELAEEVFRDQLEQQLDTIVAETGCERPQFVKLFGQTRDHWIATNPAQWLERHRFFCGTIERVAERIERGDEIFIVTTKQERFVHALLRGAGLSLDEDRVFGLERGRKKEEILVDLLEFDLPVIFVEDRLPTLLRVAEREALQDVKLQYAQWGYGTEADMTIARREPRIEVLTLENFLRI